MAPLKIKEDEIQKSIVTYCRARKILIVAPITENVWGGIIRSMLKQMFGAKGLSVAQRLITSIVRRNKAMGAAKGVHDLIVILDGKVVFVELKSATGKISPEQEKFGSEVIKRGHSAYVVRSLDSFIKMLSLEGVV